jgi:hypothetical protein
MLLGSVVHWDRVCARLIDPVLNAGISQKKTLIGLSLQ